MLELGRRQIWLVHLHEVDIDEEGLVGFGCVIEEFERRFFYVAVEEGNADDAFIGRVDIFA